MTTFAELTTMRVGGSLQTPEMRLFRNRRQLGQAELLDATHEKHCTPPPRALRVKSTVRERARRTCAAISVAPGLSPCTQIESADTRMVLPSMAVRVPSVAS